MTTDWLERPGFLHCFPLRCTMSMQQCLVNQERGKVYPFTLYGTCRKCPSGGNVGRFFDREGDNRRVKIRDWDYSNNRLEARLAEEPRKLRKGEMVKEVHLILMAQGKSVRQVHQVLVDMRAGDTARAREIWERVVG